MHLSTAAAASHAAVCAVDNAWSTWPRTLHRARRLELPGWAFYVAGRGGALGDDVRPETVAAAIGVIALDAVRAGWDAAFKVGPGRVAAARLAACAHWGDECLGDLPALGELVRLAARVVAAADGGALPLFAACRAMPMPDGGPGAAAAVLIHLMREHRSGCMLLAARACGLAPLEMIIAGPEGQQEALALGWQPPFPARIPLVGRYMYAEALCFRMVGRSFGVLEPGERAELVRLLEAAADHIRAT
jgi:hypothetical protein